MWAGTFSPSDLDPQGGYYQRLANALLSGDLYLADQPPGWLVNALNPYDPAVSAPVRGYGLHDSILFEGRYYYYWGPGTVAAIVVPLGAIGIHLTETTVGLIALVALAWCGVDLAALLQRRFRFSTSFACLLAAVLALPFAAAILTQRIGIWEGNTLAAAALGALAVQLFLRVGLGFARHPRINIVAGSALGLLATTTRSEMVVVLLIPVAMWLIMRRRHSRAPSAFLIAPGVAACAAVVILGSYNALRFGSFTDFGTSHVLGGYDHSRLLFSSLSYVPPNAYYYLLQPLVLSAVFPFLTFNQFPWPWDVPGTYITSEPVAGLVWTSPWLLVAVIASIGTFMCRARWRRPRQRRMRQENAEVPTTALGASLVVLGLLQISVVSGAIFGATERYALAPTVLITYGAAVWMAPRLTGRSRSTRLALGAGLGATLILAITAFVSGYFPKATGPSGRASVIAAAGLGTVFKATGFPSNFRWVDMVAKVTTGRTSDAKIAWTGTQAYGPAAPTAFARLQILHGAPRRFSDITVAPEWSSPSRPTGRCVISRKSGARQVDGVLVALPPRGTRGWALQCHSVRRTWAVHPRPGDEILLALAPGVPNG